MVVLPKAITSLERANELGLRVRRPINYAKFPEFAEEYQNFVIFSPELNKFLDIQDEDFEWLEHTTGVLYRSDIQEMKWYRKFLAEGGNRSDICLSVKAEAITFFQGTYENWGDTGPAGPAIDIDQLEIYPCDHYEGSDDEGHLLSYIHIDHDGMLRLNDFSEPSDEDVWYWLNPDKYHGDYEGHLKSLRLQKGLQRLKEESKK
jgi:hypothetical protein